nr:MAG TPA: hypothetical protein [Caudoviricetes sp.]
MGKSTAMCFHIDQIISSPDLSGLYFSAILIAYSPSRR